MKKIYVCSPYAGNTTRNKDYARELTRYAAFAGYAPITPHLYLTEALNDNNKDERKLGLSLAIDLLSDCAVLLLGCDFGVTPGMRAELDFAVQNGIPILAAYYETINDNGFIKRVVNVQNISGGTV